MPKQNVLMIVVDQWRGDCVPHIQRADGIAPVLRTPNLDRLCREGTAFRNHVTTSVPCGPARASLLTGLYQMNHRACQNTIPLDARHDTLPRVVRRAGYEPALVGYTTTVPDPRTSGPADPRFTGLGDTMEGWRPVGEFGPGHDAYFGWLAQSGYPLPPRREDIWLPEGADAVPGATDRPARIPAHLSDTAYFTERALSYLKGRDGQPFFLHLGYYRPHPPFVASAPYHAMYRAADMAPPIRASTVSEEAAQHPLLRFYLQTSRNRGFFQGAQGMVADLDEAAIRQMRATYFGMMTEVDDQLGRVLAWLDETGQWDDTLIVFTSDHGEQLGDHHLLGKLGYFDESFRIPLVIKAPGQKGGAIVDAPTESIDVMPTMLDWLGAPIPAAVDGSSVMPFVRGETPGSWRTELHYEFDFRDIQGSRPEATLGLGMEDASLCVVQDATSKYVHFAGLPPLFFDLTTDPNQFRNLAADPAYAERVLDYAQRALSWRLRHADRTLTHYRTTPGGLERRERV
jgi:arylsulfatase A-like enzyme